MPERTAKQRHRAGAIDVVLSGDRFPTVEL